ncbi:tripartite tricarboxylate transporter TctB family protein [Nocardiopsis sp. NPDC050513]|uniref:tripartite tricarboxylate transporter TctB family protein n=1 Tax=Nocardiopsis sp. NPDC050513 TaxID=3364338 RepID=UPI00379B2725
MTAARPERADEPVREVDPGRGAEGLERPAAPAPPADPSGTAGEPATVASALSVPALTLGVAAVLLVGGVLIRVPRSSGYLGPDFFPLTIGAILAVTACVSGFRAVRAVRAARRASTASETASVESPDPTPAEVPKAVSRTGDWRTLGIMAATLAAHAALLEPLGWLIAGTLLFWGISFALDRAKPVLDLFIAIALASLVQIAFSGLLDVALPLGLIGKVL